MPGLPWLVLPTFNEAENLERDRRRRARRARERARPTGFRILVVDDDSPDGTGAIADRLAAEHDEVEVLHRTRREGLGPAYLAGFAHALGARRGLRLRDGRDFSHDPADLARLLAAVRDGAPTSRSARATCPAAASATGARCGASSAAAARSTHGSCWASRSAT